MQNERVSELCVCLCARAEEDIVEASKLGAGIETSWWATSGLNCGSGHNNRKV